MSALVAILVLVGVTLFPWMFWLILRRLWYASKERRVLRSKYGDLKMFASRLEEWKVNPRSREERS